jgi:hypothetical protein
MHVNTGYLRDALPLVRRYVEVFEDCEAIVVPSGRVLAPGGRVVLTCWEPVNPDDERVPDRLRRVNLHTGLAAAGFSDIEVRERADWRVAERSMWEEAAALDPGDDSSLQSFHDEGR